MNTGIKPELIPIIAAYWRCECSSLNGWEKPERVYETLNENTFHHTIKSSFKLHLRPLWSITEEELRELFVKFTKIEACQIKITSTEKSCYYVRYNVNNYSPYYIFRTGSILELIDITSSLQTTQQVELINRLRSKGFCVDQCLIDADLVQWKEVENG